jgi:ADP-ribose pyrophosphatase YjhB (NUDIX family)
MIFKQNVATFIKRGKSVILSKRIEEWEGEPVPFGGYFSPFAGAVEQDENPLTAAVREIKEEAGLDFEITDLKYIKTIQREDSELILYYIEDKKQQDIKLNEEHTESGIFLISELLNLPSEFKLDEEIIKHFQNFIEKLG